MLIKYIKMKNIDLECVNTLIEKRLKLRREHNFEMADKVKEQLIGMGIAVQDTKEGSIFEVVI